MRVGDDFRQNDLSLRPGGVTICVEKQDGFILEYDKVKYPGKFINKVLKDKNNKRAWIKKD